jgi:hypothetical protein
VSRVASGAPARRPVRDPARTPEPTPARPRHLRVVDPDARRAARRRVRRHRWVARLAFVTVVGSVLLVVGIHVMMAEGQLRLDRLEAQATTAQRRYEGHRLAYAQEATPQAIVTRAQQLGLVPGSESRYLAVPGISNADSKDGTGGPDGTESPSARALDWEKVKPSLVAQP